MFCLSVFVTVFSRGPSPSLPVCLSVCRCSRMQNMLPLCGLQPLLALLLLQTVGWGESSFKCGQSASPHSAVALKASTRSALLSSRCCCFQCANALRQPDTLLPGGCSHYCSISSVNGKVCFSIINFILNEQLFRFVVFNCCFESQYLKIQIVTLYYVPAETSWQFMNHCYFQN